MARWIGTSRDDATLALGIAAGRPGVRVTCEIPAAVSDLVVPVVGGVLGGMGLARARMPRWSGDPVGSDGRLAALSTLVAAGLDPAAVRVLVAWTCGPGRSSPVAADAADCGWAQRRGGSALAVADVDAVTAQVLQRAGRAGA